MIMSFIALLPPSAATASTTAKMPVAIATRRVNFFAFCWSTSDGFGTWMSGMRGSALRGGEPLECAAQLFVDGLAIGLLPGGALLADERRLVDAVVEARDGQVIGPAV